MDDADNNDETKDVNEEKNEEQEQQHNDIMNSEVTQTQTLNTQDNQDKSKY